MTILHKAALAAGLVASSNARAQADVQPPPKDDMIVVTGRRSNAGIAASATKTATPIVETPQAISVVGSDFIDALNARTIAEALNYTSGVRSQAFGSDTRIDYYQLRGFANASFFKDGLVLTNSGAFLSWTTPAEGIDRLEVLKGPSSVLYGGGSAGGLVNIVGKPPVRTPLLAAEVGADEYGSVYGSVDAGGPLSATVSARAAGLVRRGDTQTPLARDDRTFGAGALEWRPSEAASLTVRGSYARDRSDRPTGFLPYAGTVTRLPDGRRIPTRLFVSDPRLDRYDRDQIEGGYAFDARLGVGVEFVSNGRYAELDLTYAGLFGSFAGNPVARNGSFLLNRGNARLVGSLRNVTVDNRLVGTFATGALRHTLLVGLDYSRSTLRNANALGAAPPLDVFDPDYTVAIPALGAFTRNRQRLEQVGVYVQDQVEAGGFVLVLSGRHDRVDVRTVNNAGRVATGDPTRTSYRVGLVHAGEGGLAPYASYSTSFTPLVGTQAATGDFFDPETGRQFEAGIRYQAKRLPLLATLSLFDIRRRGVLVADPRPGFPANQSQGGEQRSRGGEFELKARPLAGLDLTVAVTAFDLDVLKGAATVVGRTPTATPQFTAALFADYTLPGGTALSGLGFGGGVRHTGRSFADDVNTLVVPAATVFDAAAHYEFGPFRAALNVSNLLNKYYVAACPAAGTCYVGNLRRATFRLGYRL